VTDEWLAGRFWRWLWRPPRPHGEPITGRSVSFLELFYDLVYVAVVSQAAHHLADHVSPRGVGEFAVVFALIWVGWINGTLYLELHGREDGRTRTVVFLQMGVLVLLAVFTAEAADGSGRGFATAYAAFLALLTWLWYVVRREDRDDHPEFLTPTKHYVTGVGLSAAVVFGSAFLPDGSRFVVWACVAVGWIGGLLALGHPAVGLSRGLQPTDSLVERFGLFTIIVLGEVVFGVVGGLSASEHDVKTITTGMVALVIGFGFWWIYLDLVGRRPPVRRTARWRAGC
jgi:low temperature requirement protein LtrA